MATETTSGKALTPEHITFLEDLRKSATINMMGAAPYLMKEFELDKYEARDILFQWMRRELN